MRLALLGLLLASQVTTAAADFPIRGFPTGEEVLEGRVHKLPQADPPLSFAANGFAAGQLSRVPAPGVHPRVIMSPEDIPVIRRNIADNVISREAWARLMQDIGPDKPVKGTSMEGLYALVKEQPEFGAKAAAALVARTPEIEAKIDKILTSNDPFKDNWWVGGLRGTGIAELAEAYDYLHPFMDDAQRGTVRAVIAKGTAGRYNHGMELPRSWRTWNWVHLSTDFINATLAIEDEPGYDPRTFSRCYEVVQDCLTHKISPEGLDRESTGYNGAMVWGGNTNGAGLRALLAAARRGPRNLLMHPHLQNAINAYLGIQGGPDGPWYDRGDISGGVPAPQLVHAMKHFYPQDPRWDLLWQTAMRRTGLDGSGKPNFYVAAFGLIYVMYANQPLPSRASIDGYWRGDAGLPLTYESKTFGFMGTRSAWTPDSVQMTFACLPDLAVAGHDGPDMNTYSIWGAGTDWSRHPERDRKNQIDRSGIAVAGKGQSYGAASGRWLGVVDTPVATAGRGDATNSYAWNFDNSRITPLWSPLYDARPDDDTYNWSLNGLRAHRLGELDPSPCMREFWKYAGVAYGFWCGQDRQPISRSPNVPLQRAFRTTELVRGAHPYVLVLDDIQADGSPRHFDWIHVLPDKRALWKVDGEDLFVAVAPEGKREKDALAPEPKPGDPLLLVRVLSRNHEGGDGALRFVDTGNGYSRVIVPGRSTAPDFKVMLYPHRHGQPLPVTRWNADKTRLSLAIAGQQDEFAFGRTIERNAEGGNGPRTVFTLARDGKVVQTVGATPAAPVLAEPARSFAGNLAVAFQSAGAGREIRYTLDGSAPTAQSALYTAPIALTATTTVSAVAIEPGWAFGPTISATVQATYTRQDPLAPTSVTLANSAVGLDLRLYELTNSIWKGAHVDLESPIMPDFEAATPIFASVQPTFDLPRVTPTKPMRQMHKGFYRFTGFVNATSAGRYAFAMTSCGPTRLVVGGQAIIREDGPYYTALRERQGAIDLQPGLHTFEVVACDPAFFTSITMPVIPLSVRMAPPGGAMAALPAEALRRAPSLTFNAPAEGLELGRELAVTADAANAGAIHATIDGSEPTAATPPLAVPLRFAAPGLYTVKAALFRDGAQVTPVLTRFIPVMARSAALTAAPSPAPGMVRSIHLRTVASGSPQHFDPPAAGPEQRVTVTDFHDDQTPGQIRTYEGLIRIATGGVHRIELDPNGINRLAIDGNEVARTGTAAPTAAGRIILEPGWHRLALAVETGKPLLRLVGPDGSRDLTAADWQRPAAVEILASRSDTRGWPASFLIAHLPFSDAPPTIPAPVRAEVSVHGAVAADDAEFGKVMRFGTDGSLVLVRNLKQTARTFTVAMWLKPDDVKDTCLYNRQNFGEGPYAQRSGFQGSLKDGKLNLVSYVWRSGASGGQVVAGRWQHIAFIVDLDGCRIAIDGQIVARSPHVHDPRMAYLELLGQADRSLTGKDTAELPSEKLTVKRSYKGLAAHLRLYDWALADAQLAALARAPHGATK